MSRSICAYLQSSLNRRVLTFAAEFVQDIFGNIWLVETLDCSVEVPSLPQRRFAKILSLHYQLLNLGRTRSPDYKYIRTVEALDDDGLSRTGSASKEPRTRPGGLEGRTTTPGDQWLNVRLLLKYDDFPSFYMLVEFQASEAFPHASRRGVLGRSHNDE